MDDRYLAPALKVFVDGTALAPDVALHVARATVTLQRDSVDGFTLELVNPYPELPWTHGDLKDVFAPGMPVTVQMGYVDDLSPLIEGEVTRIAAAFDEGGTSTLRVSGATWLHRLQTATRTRTFLQSTDADIAQRVAQEAGLTAVVSGADTVTHPYVAQVNQTDLAFLRERARRIGCEIF
ncbi:MAG TPA: contractile injection system protein, VgrG/Pvc8 family, partial [Longimicrobium sp.]|nr:contractile injection system protein, VgrG/Pvc8 family [Longimicrobium sp.]